METENSEEEYCSVDKVSVPEVSVPEVPAKPKED